MYIKEYSNVKLDLSFPNSINFEIIYTLTAAAENEKCTFAILKADTSIDF